MQVALENKLRNVALIDDVISATGQKAQLLSAHFDPHTLACRMAEQVHTEDPHEGEGAVLTDATPEVSVVGGSDTRAESTLKQADATIRRLTTADMKPVETFRSMDVRCPSTWPH